MLGRASDYDATPDYYGDGDADLLNHVEAMCAFDADIDDVFAFLD